MLQEIAKEETEREWSFQSFLDCHSKQFVNQGHLASHISFFHTLHLPFPHDVMISKPWSVFHVVSNEKKPIPGFVNRLMRTMILFDQVVEVLPLSQFTRIGKIPCSLQFLYSFRVGCVFVDGDDARCHCMRDYFEGGDVAHLPYPDHSFDVIVSTISMHHWVELEQPLRDLYRMLRPGGRLWIYDFHFVKVQLVEKALASTPFAETPLEHQLVRTGFLPFALYRHFALQKARQGDHQ